MKTRFLTLSMMALLAILVSTTSCGNNDDDGIGCAGGLGWAFAVLDESEAWLNAYNEWAADPEDKDKCEDYIDAYQDYLEALRDYDNCVPVGDRDDYDDAIDEAIEEIENTDCG